METKFTLLHVERCIIPFGKRRRVPFRIVLPNSGYVSELSPCYEILNTPKNEILIETFE